MFTIHFAISSLWLMQIILLYMSGTRAVGVCVCCGAKSEGVYTGNWNYSPESNMLKYALGSTRYTRERSSSPSFIHSGAILKSKICKIHHPDARSSHM